MKNPFRISVRGLVEHSLRSGDLDLEAYGLASPWKRFAPIKSCWLLVGSRNIVMAT